MQETALGPDRQATQAPPGESIVSAWLTDLRFDWSELTQGYRRKAMAKGERLFLEGQAAKLVYVLEEGRVRLTSDSIDGKERHLMIVGASGLLGDCGVPASRNHVLSAVAITDVLVCPVPMAEMLATVAQVPVLSRQYQLLASMRFRIMRQHLALLGANSAKRRISHHLLGLIDSYGVDDGAGSQVISIAFTHQEMGNICGLSRVSVSNIFTQLEQEQVIARAGRLIRVRNLQQLRVLART
jgi:CRP-like cAMP-binding protein